MVFSFLNFALFVAIQGNAKTILKMAKFIKAPKVKNYSNICKNHIILTFQLYYWWKDSNIFSCWSKKGLFYEWDSWIQFPQEWSQKMAIFACFTQKGGGVRGHKYAYVIYGLNLRPIGSDLVVLFGEAIGKCPS